MSDKKIVVLNRGTMTYTLRPGPDGVPRVLGPGQSIETLDDKEAKDLLDYFQLADASKVIPSAGRDLEKEQKKVRELEAENAELKQKIKDLVPEGWGGEHTADEEPERRGKVGRPKKG